MFISSLRYAINTYLQIKAHLNVNINKKNKKNNMPTCMVGKNTYQLFFYQISSKKKKKKKKKAITYWYKFLPQTQICRMCVCIYIYISFFSQSTVKLNSAHLPRFVRQEEMGHTVTLTKMLVRVLIFNFPSSWFSTLTRLEGLGWHTTEPELGEKKQIYAITA